MSDSHAARAAELDAADPLRLYRDRFLLDATHGYDRTGPIAYFDGNSLGRPLRSAAERLAAFVSGEWAGRLIQGWTDGWLEWPERAGDLIGRAALGAGPGQVLVADSTTVLLYKLARAAVDTRPQRREVLLDTDNFPTDRYVLEGIAAERGLTLRWITPDPAGGVTGRQVAGAVGPDTALVVLSHVAYRSGWVADAAAITRIAHDAGALMLWDLSHSAGSVEVSLDEWGADLAVGCTYKYLDGGPGAPAFAYLRAEHQELLRQPIWGWMGRRDAFAMEPGYQPAAGLRGLLSGTPPVLAMIPLIAGAELVEEVGMPAIRAKSLLLTGFTLDLVDDWLAPLGVTVASPRDPHHRGGHVTLQGNDFRAVLDQLWSVGVIPDFREPDQIRIGLAPLSTSFAEVHAGLATFRDVVTARTT